VHVTDDTGVARVSINNHTTALVSGDVRDGWWRTVITVPRWAEPGWRDLQIDVHDRVSKPASREYLDVYKVIDDNPDYNLPKVRDITMPAKVDVRTEGQTFRFKAHITDDASGVADTYVCFIYPSDGAFLQYDACPSLELVSGTRRDGVWAADVRIRRGSVSGDYSSSVYVVDRSHSYGREFMGPTYYRYYTNDGANPTDYFAQVPNGEGDLSVVGISDPTAPVLKALSITPNDIDTLPGPVTVGVDFHLVDDDGDGVRSIGGVVCSGDNSQCFWGAEAIETPQSGSRANGWWHIDVDFPQGVSPGTYYLQVWAQDAGHWRSWISPGSPSAADVENDPSFSVLTADQLGDDPGVVNVVQH
jgi:hypothetical protein